MKKTLTINECELIYTNFIKDWDKSLSQIKLNMSSLYSLISFKKFIEAKHSEIQETVYSTMRIHGAIEHENGTLEAPPDKVNEINAELNKFAATTVEVEIKPIQVGEEDVLPPALLDIVFDFIEFKN